VSSVSTEISDATAGSSCHGYPVFGICVWAGAALIAGAFRLRPATTSRIRMLGQYLHWMTNGMSWGHSSSSRS
jgi:hypothetical protein